MILWVDIMVSDLVERCLSAWTHRTCIHISFSLYFWWNEHEPRCCLVNAENHRVRIMWRTKIKTLTCCRCGKENEKISNRWFSFHTPAFSFVLFPPFQIWETWLFAYLVDGYIAWALPNNFPCNTGLFIGSKVALEGSLAHAAVSADLFRSLPGSLYACALT